jgi:polyhydroxyalkanoate synthesis regulator phasin
VLDTAVDSRRHFQQLMEMCLKDFPIALRSDMDDVCRTTHALNKSVRALKRKCTEVDQLREEMKDLKETVAALEKKLFGTESSRAVESGAKKDSSNKTAGKKKRTEVTR